MQKILVIGLMALFLSGCGGASSTDEGETILPTMTMKGGDPIVIEVGQSYFEEGVTAVDALGNALNVKVSGNVDVTKVGEYTLTYQTQDSDGNTATMTRIVRVQDTSAPTLSVGNETFYTTVGTVLTLPTVTATDNSGESIEVVKTGQVNFNAIGQYDIEYQATDSSKNTSKVTHTYVVTAVPDSLAPVISLNGSNPMTVGLGSTYQEPGASAQDARDGNLKVSIVGSVDTSRLAQYTMTYEATDSSGNRATATRLVKVVDNSKPTLTLNGQNPMTVSQGGNYTEPGATATDNVDSNLTVTPSGTVDTSKVGQYTITYTVADAAGNQTTASRVVNVVDSSNPVITLNGQNPMTVSVGGNYSEPGASATDNVDSNLTVTPSGSVDTSKVGVYTITYTVSDAAGNQATLTRTVNVVDSTDPVITLNGQNPMTVSQGGNYTEPGATATDNVDSHLTVTSSGTVDTSKVGQYTITYRVTDAAGNEATAVRTIDVVDDSAPVISLNGDAVVILKLGSSYSDAGATALDNLDGNLTGDIVVSGDSVDANSLGDYVVRFNVQDAAGNSATEVIRTIKVRNAALASKNSVLNDTGMTFTANVSSVNSDCSGGLKPTLQDCSVGRDKQASDGSLTKVGAGQVGFDFTKLDNQGIALEDQTKAYSTSGNAIEGTKWSCVKDNHTGLIWLNREPSTRQSLLSNYNEVTWYNSNAAENGGDAGTQDPGNVCFGYDSQDPSTFCNIEAQVAKINAQGYCGANDWRIPTTLELNSIVHYGNSTNMYERDFFPNGYVGWFWTSQSLAATPSEAWAISFFTGRSGNMTKSSKYQLHLVRGN